MNTSNVTEMMDRQIFKGAFFSLSPVTIPLCILVVVQNIVVFADYYKEKATLVAGLFMGIAAADILRAQGELAVSLVSIFVYTGLVKETVLFESLLYYMVTALPGVNWSRLFNLVMTITLTVKVVNPFHSVNTSRVKKVLALCCSLILLLHISDMVVVLVIFEYHYPLSLISTVFRYLIEAFYFPGLPTLTAVLCMPDHSGVSRCAQPNHRIMIQRKYYYLLAVYAMLYFICIPLTVLICMIIQVKYLRRSVRRTETATSMSDEMNHVIGTVLWVSLLFFICNAGYILVIGGWCIAVQITHLAYDQSDQFWVNVGIGLGITEFTLPLAYALIFPIILVCRKPALRDRYVGYWRRMASCCGLGCLTNFNTENTQEESSAAVAVE